MTLPACMTRHARRTALGTSSILTSAATCEGRSSGSRPCLITKSKVSGCCRRSRMANARSKRPCSWYRCAAACRSALLSPPGLLALQCNTHLSPLIPCMSSQLVRGSSGGKDCPLSPTMPHSAAPSSFILERCSNWTRLHSKAEALQSAELKAAAACPIIDDMTQPQGPQSYLWTTDWVRLGTE